MPYTITYRTAGVWGAGYGGDLPAALIDESFYSLDQRVLSLETTPPTPVQIADITQSGTTLSIVMDDATTYGPFEMPRPPQRPTVTNNQTVSTFTPAVGEENYYNRLSDPTGVAVHIPSDADQAFAVDTEINFMQADTGPLSFDWDTATTVHVPTGFLAATDTQGAVVIAKKVGADEWDLFGKLAQA